MSKILRFGLMATRRPAEAESDGAESSRRDPTVPVAAAFRLRAPSCLGRKFPFATRPWLLALILAIVTFAAYQPTWRAGFIWDDDAYFTENPAMLSISGLGQIWSSLVASRFVPLTLTSFWVERRLWGLHPLPYHAINVTLQAVNAVLLWGVLRRLHIRGAWLAAAIWALHPVNTETVAWATELKNTQSGLFFLLALLMFLRFEGGLSRRHYAMALVFGAAAMLSKPSTVVLPGVMLLCAWWQRGRWTRNDFIRVAPLVAFGAAMSLVAIVEQRTEIVQEGASQWTLTAPQRVMLGGRAPWFYAGKVLWPADLCFVYPRWELAVHSVVAWLPLAGLALVAAILWRFRHARWAQAAIFGLGYFVIALVPVLGFFDTYFFRYSYVADHFQYLACIGLISLAVSMGMAICQRAGQRGRDLGTLAAAIVLLILGVSTWSQARVYQNVETLWGDTLAKNPKSWMAHLNLGTVFMREGRVSDEIGQYEQVLRIKPDYAEAHYNLGIALAQTGKIEEAIAHYGQALRINPDYANVHNNLGIVLAQTGKVEEAIAHYRQALRINPDYAEAHYNLGNALHQTGRREEAIAQYEQALRIKPDYAEAHCNLGVALKQSGRIPEAIAQYEQALRIKPDFAEAHCCLGNILLQEGKVSDAIAQNEQALRIRPDFAEAHYDLGLALWQAGKTPEAISQWQQALHVQPNYAEAHGHLAIALEQTHSVREAIEHYEQALRVEPDYVMAQNNLAWLLATLAPAEGGDPVRAVGLAERACKLTSDRVAPYLDTLAAAYAATGRFTNAVATAQAAVDLARSSGQAQVVSEIEARLELYRAHRPYQTPTSEPSPPAP